jgi:deoxyhypusine synthase
MMGKYQISAAVTRPNFRGGTPLRTALGGATRRIDSLTFARRSFIIQNNRGFESLRSRPPVVFQRSRIPDHDSPGEVMEKKDFLKTPIQHIDITSFDATPIIEAMKGMSFTARDLAMAAEIYDRMLAEKSCGIILTIAGSTSAAGCMQIYTEMVKNNMVDAIVATGATVVDMDFFEALGFRHYQGTPFVDDRVLRSLYIDRIYSSREFIREMGRYLIEHAVKKDSLVQAAFEHDVPIFCPAFSDSSAGFGLVLHQVKHPKAHLSIDSVKDFLELTQVKLKAGETGLLMIGGGAPKNFAQDTVVCAEVLGKEVPMHRYAVQITVADVRDGACSSSTLKEANSWGKVDSSNEQMVYAEATSVLPLLASYAWHRGSWKKRKPRRFAKIFKGA